MLFPTLKTLFVLKIFSFFCLDVSVMQKNTFMRKIWLISKFMTSQHGKQTILTPILLHISRSKGNQTMKFGQLTEYNLENIFLEKSCTKSGGETNPRPLSKKYNLNISLDQQSKVLYNLFLVYTKLRAIKLLTNLQIT